MYDGLQSSRSIEQTNKTFKIWISEVGPASFFCEKAYFQKGTKKTCSEDRLYTVETFEEAVSISKTENFLVTQMKLACLSLFQLFEAANVSQFIGDLERISKPWMTH